MRERLLKRVGFQLPFERVGALGISSGKLFQSFGASYGNTIAEMKFSFMN